MADNQHVFEDYSNYYDLFYRDKNYEKESGCVIALLKDLSPGAGTLIELGSGTGNYSHYFAEAGYHVTGIEKSRPMIERSKMKSIQNFEPLLCDMVSFDLDREYDAAVSLFDVMCYLTEDEELISCFNSISRNLKQGGVLIFDSWYTPAVYASPPQAGIRRAENDKVEIIRLAEPVMNYRQNTVAVHYEFIIRDKNNGQYRSLKEIHTLRHFNVPEIDAIACSSGFELIGCGELLTGKAADSSTWKVCYKLRKK
ncbi:class I SAM-dependent DNA methyltransferase [Hufsiella ginkgonis]|uniref:Methyltransferase domain-containing protein n=1 Tax=Hufsiella ginkgonis TaxID=2695274 RepID=A0A7K1XTB1_9SPHI|nr:class I SAM-dependent methyltransferase [Hufsiella ginkgonis]MXV14245.1 methyltransferase domain-containing protein [Hufsiella ginkgonis]